MALPKDRAAPCAVSQKWPISVKSCKSAFGALAARSFPIFRMPKPMGTPSSPLAKCGIPQAEHYYISFDIDGLDPSIAIGTGSPVPFGLLYEEASAIIEAVANKGSIVGMDMVEISPPCDHQNMTSMYGAQLMLDAMSFLTKARGKMVR